MTRTSRRVSSRDWVQGHLLVLLGLSGYALLQPVLGMLGDYPEFFVAKGTPPAEFVVFAFALALIPALAGLACTWVGFLIARPVGRAVHSFFVANLAFLLGLELSLYLPEQSDLGRLAFAGLFAGALAVCEYRFRLVRSFLRLLAVGPPLFVALFLLQSSAAQTMWDGPAALARGVEVGRPNSVMVLVLDELPISSLLTPDGSINAERFPNFARLAARSSWFRNATAVSSGTNWSVPSVLSGNLPSLDDAPTDAKYPRSLFTLLGEHYDVSSTEPITQICPASLCKVRGPSARAVVSALIDAAILYAVRVMPATGAYFLPPIDQGWGNFLGQDDILLVGPDSRSRKLNRARGEALELARLTKGIQDGVRPSLTFAHLIVPHVPWQITPSGYQYSTSRKIPGWTHEAWGDDTFLIAQAYQRHLLQVGFADVILGRLLDDLEASGRMDDLLFIVCSDHGVSFMANESWRHPNTEAHVDAIYRVPLFIKMPGQVSGEVRDDAALLIDILPTLVDALDVELPEGWSFDGRSLLGDSPPPTERPLLWHRGPDRMDAGLAGLFSLVSGYDGIVSHEGGWPEIFRVGVHAEYVGMRVSDLDVVGPSPSSFSIERDVLLDYVDLDSGFLPLLLEGHVRVEDGEEPPGELLVAINGVIAGVGGGFRLDSQGHAFSAFLDERAFRNGPTDVAILAAEGGDHPRRFHRLQRRREDVYRIQGELARDAGTISTPDGRELAFVGSGGRWRLGLGETQDHGEVIAIHGWGGDLEEQRGPDAVLLFAGGVHVATARLGFPRPRVAEHHGDGLRSSGFEILFPRAIAMGKEVPLHVVALFETRAVVVSGPDF